MFKYNNKKNKQNSKAIEQIHKNTSYINWIQKHKNNAHTTKRLN